MSEESEQKEEQRDEQGYYPSLAQEAHEALDALLGAVGKLPLNQITTRPPLHKAVIRGLDVIDKAVKEGRYVAS